MLALAAPPSPVVALQLVDSAPVTVADVIARYESGAVDIKPATARMNVQKMRRLLDVCGLTDSAGVGALDKHLVRRFQVAWLARPEAQGNLERAKITSNSILRQARSLFGKRQRILYEDLPLWTPALASFMDAPLLREPRKVYKTPPREVVDRIMSGAAALKAESPAAYAGFLLAAYCGMRLGEIASARWSWIADTPSGRAIFIPGDCSKSGTDRPVSICAACGGRAGRRPRQ